MGCSKVFVALESLTCGAYIRLILDGEKQIPWFHIHRLMPAFGGVDVGCSARIEIFLMLREEDIFCLRFGRSLFGASNEQGPLLVSGIRQEGSGK